LLALLIDCSEVESRGKGVAHRRSASDSMHAILWCPIAELRAYMTDAAHLPSLRSWCKVAVILRQGQQKRQLDEPPAFHCIAEASAGYGFTWSPIGDATANAANKKRDNTRRKP
jgi:hypothetical protein